VTIEVPPPPEWVPTHPAKFGAPILEVIADHAYGRVLDPFAGTGRIHALQGEGDVTETIGVEIEPEWAAAHPRTIVGNALRLPFKAGTFDTIATSPCYGNRLADHHQANDPSRRHSYTHDLGRPLHPDNAGAVHFGAKYQTFHSDAWREAKRVLRPGGMCIVNVSDFIRAHQVMPVVTFHLLTLTRLGFTVLDTAYVTKIGLRHGANRERVDQEAVIIARYGRARRRAKARARRANSPAPQLEGQLSIYDVLGGT